MYVCNVIINQALAEHGKPTKIMTNEELKTRIFARLAEVEALKNQLSIMENEAYQKEYPNLDDYIETHKQCNYAKGAALRMIKKLLGLIYGNWPFSDGYDFRQAKIDFIKFC